MANAFTYMFRDKTFGIKLFTVFVLVTVSLITGAVETEANMYVSGTIAAIAGFLILGHFAECIHVVKKSEDEIELPYVKPKTFIIGLKASIGAMLLNVFAGAISLFTLYIPALITAICYPGLLSVFSDEYKLSSYFAFNKAFLIIKDDFGKYFLTLLIIIFYTTLITTAMFFILNALGIKPADLFANGQMTHNMFAVTVFVALFYSYNLYVFAYLIGDLYKLDKYDTEEEYTSAV